MKLTTRTLITKFKESFSLTGKHISALVFIIFFLFGTGKHATAQDLLILKTGKELKVNIIEESKDLVKYREYENPTGPLYSIGKDKVASIQYKKGARDVQNNQAKVKENGIPAAKETPAQSGTFQPLTYKKRLVRSDGRVLSVRQVKTLMEDYPDALRLYESGKTLGNASNACAFGIIITSFAANGIANKKEVKSDEMRIKFTGLAIDGALLISGLILASAGRHHIRSAVKIYNSAAGKPVSYKLNFGLQDHGIGIALRF